MERNFWIFHLVVRVKHAHSLTSRPLKKVDPGSRLSSIIFHQSWWRHRFIPNLYSQADELSAFFWGGFSLSLSFSSPCKESAKHASLRFIGRGNVRESEFENNNKRFKTKKALNISAFAVFILSHGQHLHVTDMHIYVYKDSAGLDPRCFTGVDWISQLVVDGKRECCMTGFH